MQVCFASDLHGEAVLYDQLEELLRAEAPDLLILGGDLLADGDVADPRTQAALVDRDLLARVAVWRTALPRLTVACLVGNHESAPARDRLAVHHAAGRIVLLDSERPYTQAGVHFLGYPCTPPTPHTVKDFERRDLPEDPVPDFPGVVWDAVAGRTVDAAAAEHFRRRPSIAEELARMPVPPDPWVLVAHSPPHATALDRLAGVPYPIGSRALRRFIAERQPAWSLHGHVHESPRVTGRYSERIGATLCINPGQSHRDLYAVLLDAQRPAETLRHTVLP